jgi:hypothetical protein
MKKIVNFFKKIYVKYFKKIKKEVKIPTSSQPEIKFNNLDNIKELMKQCPSVDEIKNRERRINDLIEGRKEIISRKILGNISPLFVDFDEIEFHNTNRKNKDNLTTLINKISKYDEIILENQKKLK